MSKQKDCKCSGTKNIYVFFYLSADHLWRQIIGRSAERVGAVRHDFGETEIGDLEIALSAVKREKGWEWDEDGAVERGLLVDEEIRMKI